MDIRCEHFPELSRKAVNDSHLQRVLSDIGERFKQMRNSAFQELENGDELRASAHNIKKHTMENLHEYLIMLEKNIVNSGGHVHFAKDASDAIRIILEIADSGKVRSIVKGKSMVTEETGLNEELISHGYEVTETDLGEFIIQLSGETPFHIVGPAIHKNAKDISKLFHDKLGAKDLKTPEEMTMFARAYLRERFLNADMGITGVNFAVARTGHIVIFENEGNIRFTTTIPRIHVAVMGIEKVVPDLNSLQVLMNLLALSCTGQRLSCYVSMLKGTKKQDESDGAEQFHLIILDNGRTEVLADPDFREILYCIRCGACLNFCPVYLKAGGHSYGWVYSGPMGSVLSPELLMNNRARYLPFASTLCGRCYDVCPVMIDLPSMLLKLRQRFTEKKPSSGVLSPRERAFFFTYSEILKRSTIYNILSFLISPFKRVLLKNPVIRRHIPYLRIWEQFHKSEFSDRPPFRVTWDKKGLKDEGTG